VKTTIDIPEPLYKRAKIRAVETGQTLRQVVLASLQRELESPEPLQDATAAYWANRELRPGYAAAVKAGAFTRGTDSTVIVSEDRSSREDALL
jgi:hypothetical protein